MKITPEDLKASYGRMSDDELLELDRSQLTDMARACYDAEIEQRGLEAGDEAAAAGHPAGEPLVVIESCTTSDDASAVRSALEAAGIPVRVGEGIGQFPVSVPASYAEQARQVLRAEPPEAIIFTARYENGVFIPVEEVDLPEGTMVEVHVPAAALGEEQAEP
jgi:hypothetical protein